VDPAGSGQGPVVGSCEYSDKPVGSGNTDLVTDLQISFATDVPSLANLSSLTTFTHGIFQHILPMLIWLQ
jgi:hypothetical protein